MIGALLFLRLTSLRNQVVHRLSRLRQPKYLLGAAFAAAYFYYFVFRRIGRVGSAPLGPNVNASIGTLAAGFLCVVLCVIGLVRVAYAWIAPPEKAGLAFSEAEIAFLFPAPMTRRALIHFRLLSSQLAILFSAALITIVFNRSGTLGGHRVLHAIGWWVILSTIDLHINGTNLALARLRERSAHFLMWRMAGVATIAAYVVAIYYSSVGLVDTLVSGKGGMQAGADRLVQLLHGSGALYWLTLPFRIVLGPYLAVGYRDFAVALVPALAVLALHYYWVSSSQARFEEGSIAIAEKRAAVRAALQRGERPKVGGKPKALAGPFPLPPQGLPEVAFLWKNLLSLRSAIFSRRVLGIILGVATWAYFLLKSTFKGATARSDAMGVFALTICGIIAGYTLLLGPQIARQDLRSDLPNADLLKTFPLEGWRLALGELLAPTAILSAVLWVAILGAAASFDSLNSLERLTPLARTTLVACLAVIAPLLCLIQLIVPNTIMILVPAWYQSTRSRGGGIEMFGQRLMFGLVQLLFTILVAVPAAGAAALIFFVVYEDLGKNVALAAVLSTAAVLVILAGEAAVGLWFLGERFERFDLSTESR